SGHVGSSGGGSGTAWLQEQHRAQTATGGDGNITSVTIDWGDGSAPQSIPVDGMGNYSANHQYLDDNPSGTSSDIYTVSVTAGTASASQPITVVNVAPAPTINGAPASSPEGTLISLTSSANDPGTQDTFTYAWSVTKNGNPYLSGSNANFSFTPNDNGTYVVSLMVSDDDNGSGSDSKSISVTNVAPTAQINGAPASSPEGTAINLTSSVSDPGTADTFTYAWSVTKNGNPYNS